LAVLHSGIEAAGGSLQLCHLRAGVRRLLDLTNLTSVLKIHDSEAEAVAACARHPA
jgi:hypothetical protein